MKRISFTVQDSKVATIVSLIISEIENLVVESVAGEVPKAPRKLQKKALNGQTAREVIMTLAGSGKAFSNNDASRELLRQGFSPNTASPCIVALVKAGKLQRVGHNNYITI